MAQRRSVDKKISVSEQVNSLTWRQALIFTWGLLHADDVGFLPYSATALRCAIVPARDMDDAEFASDWHAISTAFDPQSGRPLVQCVTVEGRKFWRFPSWQHSLKKDRQPQTILPGKWSGIPVDSWAKLEVLASSAVPVDPGGLFVNRIENPGVFQMETGRDQENDGPETKESSEYTIGINTKKPLPSQSPEYTSEINTIDQKGPVRDDLGRIKKPGFQNRIENPGVFPKRREGKGRTTTTNNNSSCDFPQKNLRQEPEAENDDPEAGGQSRQNLPGFDPDALPPGTRPDHLKGEGQGTAERQIKRSVERQASRKRAGRKYSTEDFKTAKEFLMATWKLEAGDYPFSQEDAGLLGRILTRGLPMALALLQLFWREISSEREKWARENLGRTGKAMQWILPRLLDNPGLKDMERAHAARLAGPGAAQVKDAVGDIIKGMEERQ